MRGAARRPASRCCLVDVETDDGHVGTGFTAITEEEIVAAAIDEVAAPAVIGMDPMAHERIWEKLYWLLAPRGQSGYAAHAIAAIDLAVWDLKARSLDLPLWRLLGGSRDRVPIYATFGFGFFDREQLGRAAVDWAGRGFSRLKMTVGNHGLQRRDEPRPLSKVIAEDEKRVRAVREAVGPDVEICIDANCSLDAYHAAGSRSGSRTSTSRSSRSRSRRTTSAAWPTCAGARGCRSRRARTRDWPRASRDFFSAGRSTSRSRTSPSPAGSRSACASPGSRRRSTSRSPTAAPGRSTTCTCMPASPTAASSSTTSVAVCEAVYGPLPEPQNGWLELPEGPGLGFAPDPARVRELRRHGTSHGKGKA